MFCESCAKSSDDKLKIRPHCDINIINGNTPVYSDTGFDIRDGVLVKYTGKENLVSVPDGVKIIGKFAFCEEDSKYNKKYNKYIEEVILPDSVTEIESGAFYGCINLKNIVLPNSVKVIGSGVFFNCISLSRIVLPHKLTVIEHHTFYNCKQLNYIYIPKSVRKIGANAFMVSPKSDCSPPTSCPLLQTIIPDSVTEIEKYVHEYYPLTTTVLRKRETYYGGIPLDKIDNYLSNKSHVEAIRKENKLCAFCGGAFNSLGKCKTCKKQKNY